MNKVVLTLARLCGFNRPIPKTRLRRYLRQSERLLVFLFLIYAGIHLYPQALFAHSVTAEGISLYSRSPLPPQAVTSLAEAAALIRRSELAVAGRREHVFVCNSIWLFRLFHLPPTRAFAYSVPFTDHVFVAAADFEKGLATRSGTDLNTRGLSSLMAHEITHGLIRYRLGLFRGARLADWVSEGYCEYVAQDSTFPVADGMRRVAAGLDHPSRAYQYFLYRQMVAYLMDEQRLSFAQVVSRAPEYATVQRETRLAVQRISEAP